MVQLSIKLVKYLFGLETETTTQNETLGLE